MFEQMPVLEPGSIRQIDLFPLDKAGSVPDLVVVEDEVERLMWIVLAYMHATGGNRVPSSTAVLQATCVDSTVIPYLEDRLNYGKVACLLVVPGKGAVRVYLKSDFQDTLGKQEFFVYRKKGIEPSQVPAEVTNAVVEVVLSAPENEMFEVTRLPEFTFSRPKGSFAKVKCSTCGEYVFERYVRMVDGKPNCILCSGYDQTWVNALKGMQ